MNLLFNQQKYVLYHLLFATRLQNRGEESSDMIDGFTAN